MTSDVIVTGEKCAKEYFRHAQVFDKQTCQIKRKKIILRDIVVKSSTKLGFGIYFYSPVVLLQENITWSKVEAAEKYLKRGLNAKSMGAPIS